LSCIAALEILSTVQFKLFKMTEKRMG